jgi:perosamine synthetase
MNEMIVPVNEPLLDGNEESYLVECIRTGWISSEGPFIKRFEENMAKVANRKFGIAVSNGSVALDLAIVALGIGPGDEVILPSHTIISCASAIMRVGAIPVLVDCCPDTYNMDPNLVSEKITVNTKAIMLVHIFGLPVDCDPILDVAEKHNLFVIEDAAEAHGQYYKDRACGSLGHISTFSFYPNKHITTGEGWMVLTDDSALAERCRYFMNLCFDNTKRFQHEDLGWNYRMTNLQAAVGVAQIEQLDRFVKLKRDMGRRYTAGLKNCEYLRLPLATTEYAANIYWVYPIVLKPSCPLDSVEFRARLSESGVMTRPFFWPIHEQKVFLKQGLFKEELYPVSENIARRGFYIPSGMAIKKEQIDYVIKCVIDLLERIENGN